MYFKAIMPLMKDLVKNHRILQTLVWYVISLMLPLDKHTQTKASSISGKDSSLFSNLLLGSLNVSKNALNRSLRRRTTSLIKKRQKLVANSPWTIAIIIDATLHRRSSNHTQNGQKFNHGNGWVIGHQWTNIGILINDDYIPLPPIAFYTRKECKRRKIPYQTEHEKVVQLLSTLSLKSLTAIDISPSEVVVLLDAGYDCKDIQNQILIRKWDFIVSIKSSRTIASSKRPTGWKRISKFFNDGRRPWKSVRILSYRGKKRVLRQHKYKQQVGYLKDVRRQVQLVCSKRSRDSKMKLLACSNLKISVKSIILGYKKRWKIELFHRDIKSFLGLEDAGVKNFDSLHNHVHWVYVAYNLLKEKYPNLSTQAAQVEFERSIRVKEIKQSIQEISQINGKEKMIIKQRTVIEKIEVLMAA